MKSEFLGKARWSLSRGGVYLALFLMTAYLASCEKPVNSVRDESIVAYTDPAAEEPAEAAYVSVKGGIEKIYVDANVDFTAVWEDGESSPWATVLDDSETDPDTGYRVITLDVRRRTETGCYYTRRTGMLILAASDPSLNYSCILPVHQGAVARVSNDFSFLRYGKTDPRFTDDEVSIDDWTTAQLNYGFASTASDGEETPCYGKNGYLKIGDDSGRGGDIISPYTNALRGDSLLMVTFRAAAYTDFYTGVKDDNRIRVEVLDGGVIADYAGTGQTSIDLEASYYDFSDEEFPATMWDGSDFIVFVAGTGLNPVTADTRIRISCGEQTLQSGGNSRIFIDNFYIRTLEEEEKDYYFTANGGSGKDIVLGVPAEEGQDRQN